MSPNHLAAPVQLSQDHDLSSFDCGDPTLNDWLRRQALKNEVSGASRTYVVCAGNVVVGYYCLAAGAIARAAAPKPLQRNTPDPLPVIVLGRLAVDRSSHGQGIGRSLLRDAVLRVVHVSEVAGVRAILVHAISDEARQFYRANGFLESMIDEMTLCLPLATVRRALELGPSRGTHDGSG